MIIYRRRVQWQYTSGFLSILFALPGWLEWTKVSHDIIDASLEEAHDGNNEGSQSDHS